MNIIVTGDIHGKFNYLNALINKYKHKLDLVLCCGDFGYWPSMCKDHKKINTHGVPVLWCDGNHEDHWSLRALKDTEISENVFYMPRGATYKLEDGRTILFMGGAFSIDWQTRLVGRDWFPAEEVITQTDMMDLPDVKVDIIVSHTCPSELYGEMIPYYTGRDLEPSNHALSELWKIYKPDLWFFGHWHHHKEGNLGDTKWCALDFAGSGGRWWKWIPEK